MYQRMVTSSSIVLQKWVWLCNVSYKDRKLCPAYRCNIATRFPLDAVMLVSIVCTEYILTVVQLGMGVVGQGLTRGASQVHKSGLGSHVEVDSIYAIEILLLQDRQQ